MAILIRVDPDALRAAAKKQSELSEKLADASRKVEELRDRLGSAWEGGSSMEAANIMKELAARSLELSRGCADCGRYLTHYAASFEALDRGEAVSVGGISVLLRDTFQSNWEHKLLSLLRPLTGELRIIPDEVRMVSSQILQLAQKHQLYYSETKQMLHQLNSSWEGRAYDTYADQIQDLLRGFDQLSDALSDLGKQLRNTAERYEELDNLLAQ